MSISLPDLKVKVRVDDAQLDALAIKSKVLGETIDRHLQPAGQAFVRFGKDGELASLRISSASARTSGDLDRLAERARIAGRTLGKDLGEGVSAVIKLGDDGEAALSRLSSSVDGVGRSGQAGASGLAGLAGAGAAAAGAMGPLVLVIVALGVALVPVVILLSAFTLGVTAAATAITVGLVGIVALGAAVVLLAQRVQGSTLASQNAAAAQKQLTAATNAHQLAVQQLDTFQANAKGHRLTNDQLTLQADLQKQVAKTSYDLVVAQNAVAASSGAAVPPLQQLTDRIGKMADVWGHQAVPIAAVAFSLLNSLIDPVQALGSAVITWFGNRAPAALQTLGEFLAVAFAGLSKLGVVLGRFFDAFIGRGPQFEALFGKMLDVGVAAIDGLLTVLLQLSDWFQVRLPTLGPIVAGIMGGIGAALLGIGAAVGALTDFFIAAWPGITAAVTGFFSAIATGWQWASPVLGLAVAAFHLLDPLLGFIRDHATDLKPVLYAVGALLVIMAASTLLTAGTVVVLIAAVVGLVAVITAAVGWLRDHFEPVLRFTAGAAASLFLELNPIAGIVMGIVGAVESAIGAFQRFADAIRNLPTPNISLPNIPGLHFASGGVALPGSVFSVGEAGPEMGYALPGGGVMISPGPGTSPSASGPSMASTERLLDDVRGLLRVIARNTTSSGPPPMGMAAYGRA